MEKENIFIFMNNKVTVQDIVRKKGRGKITMLTCYDYSFAKILDSAGVDIILVGDSLANVVLGLKQTRRVSISEMLKHTAAVAKGVKHALVVADLPYSAYQKTPPKCVEQAQKFIRAGASAVKVEWFGNCLYVVRKLIQANIPVMGHIGLTPQTVHLLGGYRIQGRDQPAASRLINQAEKLQDCGVFSIVLECIPYQLARRITARVKVPTLGIGAGKYCDGQVLVLYDFLGLSDKKLKFVRIYQNLSASINRAVAQFSRDVKNGRFPSGKESFT